MFKRSSPGEPARRPSGSLSKEYFEQLYAQCDDPWNFATSDYEARKYAATLDALPRPCYHHALELGCSIGVFTAQLAPRCNRLLAVDVAQKALAQARERCQRFPHVCIEGMDFAEKFPVGSFDLIILSEVGYYLAQDDLLRTRAAIANALVPGGHLLLVHYIGTTNYPLTADAVHEIFISWKDATWISLCDRRETHYRLDVLLKR
jgi:SAM-dependent methyltransferase